MNALSFLGGIRPQDFRFEDAVELEQAVGHHGEVGHHVVLAEETAVVAEEKLIHAGKFYRVQAAAAMMS